MMLWFALTAMISVAAIFVSAPFIRRYERRRMSESSGIAVYRDQLKEIDAEAALGLIDAEQAESARTEIKRRILAITASADGSAVEGLSSGERTFAAVAVAAVVVGGSVGLYALTANLEPAPTPTPPFAKFDAAPRRDETAGAARESGAPFAQMKAAPGAETGGRPQTSLPPVEELIQKLVARLQRNPKDVEGWRTLGWSYYSTDHFTEAAAAYARAIELKPESVEFRNGRTEAMIRAANGVVTPEAKAANEETLKLNSKDQRARYFNGLVKEQAGDKDGAQKDWKDLLAEIDPNHPWAKELRQKLDLPDPAPSVPNDQAGAVPSAAERGPTSADVRAAESMAPSDRSAMIERMVQSLADRLEKSPNDPDGWIKLIRSWSVLGDKEKLKQALDKAMKNFVDGSAERKKVEAAAEELGLGR
jgi:cytochrome c-type biogenesis protein CcmH